MDSPIVQIKKYFYALYTHRYIFVFVSATLAVFIVAGSFFVPKKYEAKSTVFIEKNVINNLMKGLTISPAMADRIRVLRYSMLSRDMVIRVLKNLDKDVSTETSEAFERLVEHCQKTTDIILRGDDLFFVSIVSSDPYFARDFINTLVSAYVEENLAAKREESFGANRFLTEQVDFYKKKLDTIEDQINQFRKKTSIFSTVTESSLIEEIKIYDEELKNIQVKKNEMLATVNTINEQIKMMKSTASVKNEELFDISDSSDGDPRIGELESTLDNLLLVYNEQYPAVVKLREQIAELEKRQQETSASENVKDDEDTLSELDSFNPLEDPIFVDLKMRVNSTQSDLNALQAREKELLNQIAHNKQLLENFPQDKKVLADMERERNMNKNVYESLLERVGVSEVSKQMEVADKATTFRIVDPAILPTVPVGMKRIIIMIMGLFGGLASGLAAVFIRVKLDDTVKDSDTIRTLGVVVLAEIPLMYNEIESRAIRRKDKIIYAYGGFCLLFVGAMISHDLLGLGWVDRAILHMSLDKISSDIINFIR